MSKALLLCMFAVCIAVVANANSIHETSEQKLSRSRGIPAHGLPVAYDVGDHGQAEQAKEMSSGSSEDVPASNLDKKFKPDPFRPTWHPPIKGKAAKTILWITFLLMLASAIAFSFIGSTKPKHLRAHAFVSTGIVSFAAAAYFAIATNKGYTDVSIHRDSLVTRGVFYARYIDWLFTTPLLLLDILLIAGTDFGTTLWIVFCDVAMIALGLFGSVIPDSTKWGWFGFACAFQLLVTYGLLGPALISVRKRSNALGKIYIGFAAYLAVLWLGYPVVWGLSEGSNTISSDAEAIIYAILDIAAKVVFGWAIILSTSSFQREIVEAEKREGVDDSINALTTPINLLWGVSGSTAAAHNSAEGNVGDSEDTTDA